MKVLVHSLEKTGTTTVMEAVRSAGIEVGRGHQHNIADLDLSEYTYIITMVRDPIARAISNCFELRRMNPELNIYPSAEWVARSALEDFSWFQKFYEPFFGWNNILEKDVLNNIKEKRCYLWATMNMDWGILKLAVMRTEDISLDLANVLSNLLMKNREDFTIEHRAKGVDRFEDYETFLSRCKFNDMMLNSVYGNKYCTTFYTPEEIEGFKKRWRY